MSLGFDRDPLYERRLLESDPIRQLNRYIEGGPGSGPRKKSTTKQKPEESSNNLITENGWYDNSKDKFHGGGPGDDTHGEIAARLVPGNWNKMDILKHGFVRVVSYNTHVSLEGYNKDSFRGALARLPSEIKTVHVEWWSPKHGDDVLSKEKAIEHFGESKRESIDRFGENGGDGSMNMLDGHRYKSLATHEAGIQGMKWGIHKGEVGHGTSEANAKQILKKGLKAQEQEDPPVSPGVFLTKSTEEAHDYATTAVGADVPGAKPEGRMAIVVLKNPGNKLGLKNLEDYGLYHKGSISPSKIDRVEIYDPKDVAAFYKAGAKLGTEPKPVSVLKPGKESFGDRLVSFEEAVLREGGSGSGDFGHEGRPGEIGGSGGGGAAVGEEPKKERKPHRHLGAKFGLPPGVVGGGFKVKMAKEMFGKHYKELTRPEKNQVKAAIRARGIIRPQGKQEASAGEKELQEAKALKTSRLGGGVSETYIVEMEGGLKGVFKESSNENRNEVASWQVAKLAGMEDIHPPVVFRDDIKGPNGKLMEKGSLMKFWDGKRASATDTDKKFDGDDDLHRALGFDYIIGNLDRHDNNWMISNEGKMQLIDHGRAFGFGIERGVNFRPAAGYMTSEVKRREVDGKQSLKPSDVAKPFVEKKQEILDALKKVGLREENIKGVGDRIDRMARKDSWRSLLP